ncbi:MAG: SpoIIIAH-like family protein [Lachnospiraceae bacterium]|nr:SpoIIIAH-like family protein [Lachnospiraceae bacterium]
MKKIIKKNQVIIAALALLLGVAGYINFSGNTIDLAKGNEEGIEGEYTEVAFVETDIEETAGEVTLQDIEDEENIELNSDEENIGEAVYTSADTAPATLINMKLNREQVRSKSKEYYLEIINGDNMDEMSVQSATDAYIKMTEDMEKESEAETLLAAKGFSNSIVSIGDGTVDVVIGKSDITDVEKAQIEDIVVRKTGCNVEDIIITTVNE